jgi:4-amino-4-deoxy-L-arabinose transferase-like glycosyltransferase
MKKTIHHTKSKKSKRSTIKYLQKFLLYAWNRKIFIFVIIIFLFELFLRFYQIADKNPFGYDQVDNAWTAKNLIVNHQFPLVGMVAKENSGIYLGPVYYYLISFFYWIFQLNPIASGVFAGITSIFTFWVIFYVAKKLFSTEVAIIAVLINTFNFSAILFDRVQWNVNFLPGISLLIFYFLYKVMTGDVKKLIPLAIAIGLAFNVHFTAVFFPIIVLLAMPFFSWNKETIKYIVFALPLFIIWLVPNIIYQVQQKSVSSNYTSYLGAYYHGFHLVRMRQIAGDALIQFNPYLLFDKVANFKFIAIPLFFILYLYKSFNTERKKFIYLVFIWFMVPWIVFTTYSGEISDYYFATTRFVALLILSYFLYKIWNMKYLVAKIAVIIFLVIYCWYGFKNYLPYRDPNNLTKKEATVMQSVNNNTRIEFQVGVPESYIYYYYMKTLKNKEVY